jgi:hypothetical protein
MASKIMTLIAKIFLKYANNSTREMTPEIYSSGCGSLEFWIFSVSRGNFS